MSTSPNLAQRLTELLGDVLERQVEPFFKHGCKFTLIVRTPGNDRADVLVTNDDLAEVRKLIERRDPLKSAPVITAAMVQALRAKTDGPLMDCKRALVENDGDAAKAEEWLRLGKHTR